MEEDGFRDRGQRFSYLVACENARRILADPSLIAVGRAHLDRFAKADPHQRDAYALWNRLLEEGAKAVAAALTDRSAQGDYARETAPSFGALSPATRASLLQQARTPLPAPAKKGAA